MEQESFPAPDVVARTRSDYVAVKLRADVDEELALGFNLTGLPATVLVDPSRTVLAVHQGYLGPDDLGGVLGRAVAARPARFNPEDLADGPRLASETVGPPEVARGKSAKREEHVELSGYCPVSLVAEKKLVEGQAEYAVSHQGRVYKFANRLTFNLFRRDPERYVPANDGRCPVEQLEEGREAPGDPRFGALYKGRLYLCSSNDDRLRFVQDPERYATVGVEARGNCPHCLDAEGLAVPGDPRYSLTQGGRRYWFPDESHRSAFMSLAPSRSIRR
jgi:YHS domain-containing protein